MTAKSSVEPVLHIDPLKRGGITVKLIGTTPFYFNAMSAKAKRTLLIGGGKKTAAERREFAPGETVALVDHAGALLGLAEYLADDRVLAPRTVFVRP